MGSVRPDPRTNQETSVLKKAGILVGVATAGVLALTPFAFAWDNEQPPAEVTHTSIEEGNLTNDCPIDQSGQTITDNLAGGDSFLGAAGAVVNGPNAPVSAPVATLNCLNLNVEDV